MKNSILIIINYVFFSLLSLRKLFNNNEAIPSVVSTLHFTSSATKSFLNELFRVWIENSHNYFNFEALAGYIQIDIIPRRQFYFTNFIQLFDDDPKMMMMKAVAEALTHLSIILLFFVSNSKSLLLSIHLSHSEDLRAINFFFCVFRCLFGL